MKKAIFILALATIAHFASAQKIPMSNKGYWVIESNKQTPKQSVVNFYNLNNELVYQETITGKKVKVDNNRTRKVLQNTLETVLEGKKPNEPILAMAFSK